MEKPIILASSSPRRQDLLRQSGINFEICICPVDESEEGCPSEIVVRLALKKARAALMLHPDSIVLAADTLVFADGKILGKPQDSRDAFRMLNILQGDWHEVYTGVCVLSKESVNTKTAVCVTRVQFVHLTEAEIKAYIETCEPFGKAGAYAIQGLAGMFVKRIEGSYSNVVGLPLHILKPLLEEMSRKLL